MDGPPPPPGSDTPPHPPGSATPPSGPAHTGAVRRRNVRKLDVVVVVPASVGCGHFMRGSARTRSCRCEPETRPALPTFRVRHKNTLFGRVGVPTARHLAALARRRIRRRGACRRCGRGRVADGAPSPGAPHRDRARPNASVTRPTRGVDTGQPQPVFGSATRACGQSERTYEVAPVQRLAIGSPLRLMGSAFPSLSPASPLGEPSSRLLVHHTTHSRAWPLARSPRLASAPTMRAHSRRAFLKSATPPRTHLFHRSAILLLVARRGRSSRFADDDAAGSSMLFTRPRRHPSPARCGVLVRAPN